VVAITFENIREIKSTISLHVLLAINSKVETSLKIKTANCTNAFHSFVNKKKNSDIFQNIRFTYAIVCLVKKGV